MLKSLATKSYTNWSDILASVNTLETENQMNFTLFRAIYLWIENTKKGVWIVVGYQ